MYPLLSYVRYLFLPVLDKKLKTTILPDTPQVALEIREWQFDCQPIHINLTCDITYFILNQKFHSLWKYSEKNRYNRFWKKKYELVAFKLDHTHVNRSAPTVNSEIFARVLFS